MEHLKEDIIATLEGNEDKSNQALTLAIDTMLISKGYEGYKALVFRSPEPEHHKLEGVIRKDGVTLITYIYDTDSNEWKTF